MIDYHMHTPLCHHATGSPAEYLEVARQKGIGEIGFADHYPLGLLGVQQHSPVTMSPGELSGYINEIRALAANEKEITVRLGIEVDYIPGKEETLAELLPREPFDYIIGSIHFMGDWDFTHPRHAALYNSSDLGQIYSRYFELLWQACSSGLFDIMGHIDVVKKFGHRLPDEAMEFYWQRTASILKKNDLCFELNTAGRAAPAAEFYPGRRLLELCSRKEVPVTLGSDAHGPEQVGRYFDDALALLHDVGYRELAVFSRRQRNFIPLEREK
ncbi:MAG: histidinol-phosphatase HisJ family protein [Firmicutes bacterium]|nr:histidinol-phosphatase HisJ family protein [Bacillota bacterium]